MGEQQRPTQDDFNTALRVILFLKEEIRKTGAEYGASRKNDLYADFLRDMWVTLGDIEDFITDEFLEVEYESIRNQR